MNTQPLPTIVLFLTLSLATSRGGGVLAEEPHDSLRDFVGRLNLPTLHVRPIGVDAWSAQVKAVVHDEDADYSTKKARILLVGNSQSAEAAVNDALAWFYTNDEADKPRQSFVLSAVPNAGLDGRNSTFPPRGNYYSSKNPAPQYLWRWIGIHAPDLVVQVAVGTGVRYYLPEKSDLQQFKPEWRRSKRPEPFGLAAALVEHKACDVGTMPAIGVEIGPDKESLALPNLLALLHKNGFRKPSAARQELHRREQRTPVEIADQLSQVYGHQLNTVAYIPALALVGRLRLGELTDNPDHAADVAKIVSPYVDGTKATKPNNGSALSGHLIFSELAERSANGDLRNRYLALAGQAADLGFSESGGLNPSMPFHNEMSDTLFMGGPILAHVGKLKGDPKYFDMCLRHLRYMRKLVLREDGIYRHSPLDDAAWGRGNGFPALGVALCLRHWPADREDRAELLLMFQKHMRALAEHQDPSGSWHQVIDRPDTYREFSCTCMITFAAALGVRHGWLPREEFDPVIRRGWRAIRIRIGNDGRLVDVCTGTGKQRSLTDYYHRKAILGRDDRGGAMALLATTEMAHYLKGN